LLTAADPPREGGTEEDHPHHHGHDHQD
jgi:hypothetical protein